MGFSWNDKHTDSVGLFAEAKTLPILPEPILITEQVPGRDGFYDFSAFNSDNRVHYKSRDWEYRCAFDSRIRNDTIAKVEAVTSLFSKYTGYLIDDRCPNVRWQGVVTNKFNLSQVAKTLHTFGITMQTQPFAEGLEPIEMEFSVDGTQTVTVANPGTWFVKPVMYATGTAAGLKIEGVSFPYSGALTNQRLEGIELKAGNNKVTVRGFSGVIRFSFTPLYIWGVS